MLKEKLQEIENSFIPWSLIILNSGQEGWLMTVLHVFFYDGLLSKTNLPQDE